MMEIYLSKEDGFCFGVTDAIARASALKGEHVYLLGEIIHNEAVTERLKKAGIKVIEDVEEAPCGTLVIRAHGAEKAVYERAAQKGLKIVDCTCPNVRKIQDIVRRYYADGYQIVILGKATHPEVVGLNGWCDRTALIIDERTELDFSRYPKACIVAQTTFSDDKFEFFLKNIPKEYLKTVEIFKTICYTTIKRQKEAARLAETCDAIVVLGSFKSNNTKELYEICRHRCNDVFWISRPDELDYKQAKKFKKVGIVSGASTPREQSLEVISNMENITEVKTPDSNEEVAVVEEPVTAVEAVPAEEVAEVQPAAEESTEKVEASDTMEAAIAKMDKKPQRFRIGQVITATISAATEDGLALYITNTKKEIMLAKEEMTEAYNKAEYENKIGDEIRVMIVGLDPVVLSEKAMVKVLQEEAEIEEIKNGKIFTVTVTGSNKGGLTSKFGSYQVFIPSSQIRIGYVKDLEKYVGKELRLKAEKVETEGRRQIVASQRVILEAERAEREAQKAERERAFFESIHEGDIVTGTVVRFAAFGAFVQVNGFDCLAHISDLCWTGCKNCADVLELNQSYQFKVLKVDEAAKKVSIGYKQLQPKPWDLVPEKYHVGDVIKGKVVRIVSFGAFVEVEKEVDGLVHVSQISNEWLENPTSALKVGEEIEAKILEIDPEKEKMTLSIKALLPEAERKPRRSNEKSEGEEKPKRSAKRQARTYDDDELRGWTDDNKGGSSIADLLGNLSEE